MKVIGIDPGKETGIAVYDTKINQLILVESMPIWGAISFILDDSETRNIELVIEVPKNKRVHHKQAVTRGAIERTAVNVGSVCRDAEIWCEFAAHYDIPKIIQRPQGKIKADEFKRITGWQGRTNQHGRDAGMLCYGVKV